MNNRRINIWLCKAFVLVLILNIFGISKGFAQPDTIYFNTEVLSGFNLLNHKRHYKHNTILQYHWAGRLSRGVTQFHGNAIDEMPQKSK